MKINTIRQWGNEVRLGKLWRGEYSVPLRGFLHQVVNPKLVLLREKLLGFNHFTPQTKALSVSLKTINLVDVFNLYRSSYKRFAIFHIYSLTLKTLKTSFHRLVELQTYSLAHRAYRYHRETKEAKCTELQNRFLNKVAPYHYKLDSILHLLHKCTGTIVPLNLSSIEAFLSPHSSHIGLSLPKESSIYQIPSNLLQHLKKCSYGFLYPSKCLWHKHSHLFSMLFMFFIPRGLTLLKSTRIIMGLGRSFVVRLFNPSRPSAILLRVISVIVYPFNRSLFYSKLLAMFLVRGVHILSKFVKSFPKTFNATTPVILPIGRFRIQTSASYAIIGIAELVRRKSVLVSRFTKGIGSSTTARNSVSVLQIIADHIRKIATFALAFPNRIATFVDTPKDGEFAELLPRKFLFLSHKPSIARSWALSKYNCGDNLNYIYG